MKKTFKSLLSIFLAVFMVASLMAIPSSAAAKLSKTSVTVTKGYGFRRFKRNLVHRRQVYRNRILKG